MWHRLSRVSAAKLYGIDAVEKKLVFALTYHASSACLIEAVHSTKRVEVNMLSALVLRSDK